METTEPTTKSTHAAWKTHLFSLMGWDVLDYADMLPLNYFF
jgi:hypothetical protein